MLDVDTLQRIRLTARPRVQRFIAWTLLFPNYSLPPRVRIELEGAEQLPDEPVVFAMNHTDRYNYWPFQYALYRQRRRFTATWVKGKYYENLGLAKFMEWTNNIPTVSRGYLISKDFLQTLGRAPKEEEYSTLRRWVDAAAIDPGATADLSAIPETVLKEPRNPLGRPFDPQGEDYAAYINGLFRIMMKRFVELNAEAFDKGLDLLIFPQGTRSIRLPKGHIGLAQIVMRYRRTVVPIGCNGCDHIYPGGSPLAKGGTVVYRFGAPIPYDEMKEFHPSEPYEPFTPEAESKHQRAFQGLTDVVMDRINDLLDEPYQRGEGEASDGVEGANRFV